MKKQYFVLLAGLILSFAVLTGCGANPSGQLNTTSESGNNSGSSSNSSGQSTEKEQELQSEIDALRQELNELKSADTQNAQNSTPSSDNSQTTGGSQTTDNSQAQTDSAAQVQNNNSGAASSRQSPNVSISLEQAKQTALARVAGATDRDMTIHLDFDDGWYIYEGDILYNRVEYEFEIDANTGTILKWEEERW